MWLRSQDEVWLTSLLQQWFNSVKCSSICVFLFKKNKSRMLYANWWRPAVSWRTSTSVTRCWRCRPSVRKRKQHSMLKNLVVQELEQNQFYAQDERERKRHKRLFLIIQKWVTKVWLRVTTLYIIYRSSLHLDYPSDNVNRVKARYGVPKFGQNFSTNSMRRKEK